MTGRADFKQKILGAEIMRHRFRVPCSVLVGGTPSIEDVLTDSDGYLTTKYGQHFETWQQAHTYLLACVSLVEERAESILLQSKTNTKLAKNLTPNA
jgi:hypothetical protein